MIETQAPPSSFLKNIIIISSLMKMHLRQISKHSDNKNLNISAAFILH